MLRGLLVIEHAAFLESGGESVICSQPFDYGGFPVRYEGICGRSGTHPNSAVIVDREGRLPFAETLGRSGDRVYSEPFLRASMWFFTD